MTLTEELSARPNQASSYRADIDGLRAIAVLAVIVNHFNEGLLRNGFLGVDIFFVISGYVITSSLYSRSWTSRGGFLLGFYSRRVKRILPALSATVLISAAAICMVDPDPGESLKTGMAALIGFSNISLIGQSVDYFGDATRYNPFTHTWSLGVEEQFYLVFPLIFLFSGKALGRNGSIDARSSMRLLLAIGILSALSFIGFIVMSKADFVTSYFLMPTRFWEIGAGCLLFLVLKSFPRVGRILGRIPPLPVFVALLVTLSFPNKVRGIIAIVGLTLLLIGSCKPSSNVYRFLTLRPLLFIGVLSYSLYLWHWPVITLSRWTIGLHGWTLPFQLITILLLSWVSYNCLETPLRRARWSSEAWRTIGYGFLLIGASAGLIASILRSNFNRYLFAGDYLTSFDQVSSRDVRDRAFGEGPLSLLESKCRSGWWRGDGPEVEQALDQCDSTSSGSETRRFFIIGDSHTGKLLGWFRKAIARPEIFVRLTNVGGQIVPVTRHKPWPVNETKLREMDRDQQREIVALTMESLSPGDTIILSSYFRLTFRTQDRRDRHLVAEGQTVWELWLADLESMVQTASDQGASVVLVLPTPDFSYPEGPRVDHRVCSPQWFRPVLPRGCFMGEERQKLVAENNELSDPMRTIQKKYPNLYLYNPFDVLCPPSLDRCANYLHDQILYKDNNHVNNAGIRLISDDFDRFLRLNRLL